MKDTSGSKLLQWFERALWAAAIASALLFAVIKVRAWGGVIDAPEQSDFESYYLAAHVAMLTPEKLYQTDSYTQVIGAEVHPPATVHAPAFAALFGPLAALPYSIARRVWF